MKSHIYRCELTDARKNPPNLKIRIPADLKEWLKNEAARNHRTMNGEILVMLSARRARKCSDARKAQG